MNQLEKTIAAWDFDRVRPIIERRGELFPPNALMAPKT